MANTLSTANLESAMFELSNSLTNSEWNDEVKESYFRFINEENVLLSNIKWMSDKANAIFNNVTAVDVEKFKATYSECVAKLERLQRGG